MYKVVIADDDSLFRRNLINSIDWNAYGLKVTGEAANGRELLDLVEETTPDIVICDIKMPVMDGISVLKNIPDTERLKFIILSGYNDFEFTKQAIIYGAFDYALKPLDLEELSGILMRAVEVLNESIMQRNHAIELNIELRKFMVGNYESLLIHFIESRDISSICEYIDSFYSGLRPDDLPHVLSSSFTEFLIIMDKACSMFKLDSSRILDKYRQEHSIPYNTNQKHVVAECVKSLFTEIVNQLITVKNSECKRIVDEVVEYIEKNFSEKISLESIAKRYFINPSYFSQVFKSRTNESFTSYLIRVRMEKARELLRLGRLKVYQVAEMVGYNSEKHFCQIFKKYTGLSPTEFSNRCVNIP